VKASILITIPALLIVKIAMFLYAKLVMHNLQSQTKVASLRKELGPECFPKNLNQA